MNKYLLLSIQGIVIASLYFYTSKIKKRSCDIVFDKTVFIKTVLFYVFIQEVATLMTVKPEIITMLFLSRIISIYLDSCEPETK